MYPEAERQAKRWDKIGTVMASLGLVASAFLVLLARTNLDMVRGEFGRDTWLRSPIIDLARIVCACGLLDFLLFLLFLWGISILLSLQDRVRANLYAGLVALILAIFAGVYFAVVTWFVFLARGH